MTRIPLCVCVCVCVCLAISMIASYTVHTLLRGLLQKPDLYLIIMVLFEKESPFINWSIGMKEIGILGNNKKMSLNFDML